MRYSFGDRLTVFVDRETWLARRREFQGVSGSTVANVLGCGRISALEQFTRDVGITPPPDESVAMRAGQHLEPWLAREFERDPGIVVDTLGFALVTHPTIDGLFFSPDGVAPDGWGWEAKSRTPWGRSEWDEGVPEEVWHQCQLGCEVLDVPGFYVAAWLGGNDYRWCRVPREPVWWADHEATVLDYIRRVREGDPPPPDGTKSATEALTDLWPVDDSTSVLLDNEALDLHWSLQDAKKTKKAADARVRELQNHLKAMIGEHTLGVLPGNAGAYRWAIQKRKGFTVEPSESRVLRYRKAK